MFKQLYKFLFVDDLTGTSVDQAPIASEPLQKKLMRDLTGLTLFAYLLLVFNPVMPLIADKMAHTFWLEYHLVTVHHVYGSRHLHLEMADNTKRAEKEKSSANSKSSADEYVHVIPDMDYHFVPVCFKEVFYTAYIIDMPVSYTSVNYQPPRA